MRTFYVNEAEVQKSLKCPAGFATCPAFDFLKLCPNVRYSMQGPFNVSVFIGPVQNPTAISLKIQSLCDECLPREKHHIRPQRER
ncbi:MAG: hypothetical protein J6T27_02015 [Alphaproteobacteria bacterium]|nr:hypothetical protein [Alphaproteobacteria bacterium]